MNATLSKDIIKILQNDRSASDLVSTILSNRSSRGSQGVTITVGKQNKTYRPIASQNRSKR